MHGAASVSPDPRWRGAAGGGGREEERVGHSRGSGRRWWWRAKVTLGLALTWGLAVMCARHWEPGISVGDNVSNIIIGIVYVAQGAFHDAIHPHEILQMAQNKRYWMQVALGSLFDSRDMHVEDLVVPWAHSAGETRDTDMTTPEELSRDRAPIHVVAMRPKSHNPERDAALPVLFWFHGGGMVIGEARDALFAPWLVRELPALVLSVEYGLAPEAPFPIGVHDAFRALEYLTLENPSIVARLGGDVARVGVAGHSAGGNIAAAVAQMARNASLPLALHAPINPMLLHYREAGALASYSECTHAAALPAETMEWFWNVYTGGDHTCCQANPKCEPLAGSMTGLAPCVLVTSTFDVLRDEGREYVKKCRLAGVPTEHIEAVGSHFGGVIFDTDAARRTLAAMRAALSEAPA